ncbi:hypothetical protein JKP88DRAFT_265776 [Tribonema minus]|uniref:RING-type domain-containing protein n=1 Tax=Tribonema minus TaxID=303371 RepID=A0A836C717_9STRA|nr:hypothetical protein JKP88DRAFT_265776 [Tribonema minus]
MAWIMVLLLCLVCHLATASLVAYDENGGFTVPPSTTSTTLTCCPQGITGRLRVAKPDIFGCAPLDLSAPGDEDYTDMESGLRPALPIVVLLSRSLPKDPAACSFATKVVYVDNTDPYEQLFFSLNMTMVAVVTTFLLALLLCASLFLCSSERLLGRREAALRSTRPLSLAQAARLPEVVVAAGGDLEKDRSEKIMIALNGSAQRLKVCCGTVEVVAAAGGDLEKDSICLEDYTVGERLVRLTCAHVMHRACVLPWISERQRTCPLCKTEVVPPPPLRTPSSAASQRIFPYTYVPPLQANRSAARRAAAAAAAPRRASADAAAAAAPAGSGGSNAEGRTRLLSAPAQATNYGAV